jgi:DNA repair exonuclease SbcCD ATPase subunit
VTVEAQIVSHRAQQKTLTEHFATAKKLEGKLDNFEAEFVRLTQECEGDFGKLSLDMGEIVKLNVDKTPLVQKRDSLVTEKGTIDAALSLANDKSLLAHKAAYEGRIKALQDELDAPNRLYQAYQEALKAWQEQKNAIRASCSTCSI